MRLVKLEYSQFEGKQNEWRLENCSFGDINLMVGMNATGKTRTLNILTNLAHMLSDQSELPHAEGNQCLEFVDSGSDTQYLYKLEHHQSKVTCEEVRINGELRLSRDQTGVGEIYAEEVGKMIRFKTPLNQVAANVKRDELQHPFLEPLYSWGAGMLRYNFGTPMGQKTLAVALSDESDSDQAQALDLRKFDRVVQIYLQGHKEHGQQFDNMIIDDMADIGYQLDEVGVTKMPGRILIKQELSSLEPLGIYTIEADTKVNIPQPKISQGMFRALSLLTQVNYSLLSSAPSCILIDDIGEGLDFERASALVKKLIAKSQDTSIQLLMTTNDRFIMNAVPLDYWIVLERSGNVCFHHNYRNSKKMFESFELTGLSNFDLFASGYYRGYDNEDD